MNQAGGHVLLADIGGTNARFALADVTLPRPLLDDSIRKYPVTEFPSLSDAAQHYLGQTGAAVCDGVFAVAGRVDGDEARITNHPWVISRPRLTGQLGLGEALLINDFAAQAMAIPLLREADVAVVGGAAWRPHDGVADCTYAVIGPGTGLGVGTLVTRDGRHYPLESEGGHVSFPPGTPEELAILDRLSRQFGRVSNERLICGPGLVNIHRALSEIAGEDPGPVTPADVTARAQAGDARCMRAVDVFCAVFGAIAGDLVLTVGAWDGVFLTGGMVPKMLGALQHSGFRQRFEHKGRFSSNMARVPSVAVLHPEPGLLGAAAVAGRVFAAEAAP
ncbi:glucokinase [Luteimonas sp. SJ-92]|uniref:Glucokinase n=1 Tax=Luteimonas salinisoli TaxID=2752307 RepID=A0A853JGE2_9GAMM|nr:glucokinase [Luteimonas salinisoli]